MNMHTEIEKPATFDVLGLDISVTSLPRATQTILDWQQDDIGRFVCVRDVHGVMLSLDNPTLFALHSDAAMITPDGMPLVALGRMAGLDVNRTCGADLMEHVIESGQKNGLKHYFYGGKPGVAEALRENFTTKFPDAKIVGTHCPAFHDIPDSERLEIIKTIKDSGADVVWVGLSTPKQEFWMHRNFAFLPATLIGVGAAFDFHTGAVKRAPVWMQRSGLEWSHRLFSEPKRLWRRYLILAPRFVGKVLMQNIFGKTK